MLIFFILVYPIEFYICSLCLSVFLKQLDLQMNSKTLATR